MENLLGREVEDINKTNYNTTEANTPWKSTWGSYNKYSSSLNKLSDSGWNTLYRDVVQKNPSVGGYYDINNFKKAAKDNKIGMVHNSIIPEQVQMAEPIKPLQSKPVGLGAVPPVNTQLAKTPVKSYAQIQFLRDRQMLDPNNAPKNTQPIITPNSKLATTSGGMTLRQNDNKVARDNMGLVDRKATENFNERNQKLDRIAEARNKQFKQDAVKNWKPNTN